MADKTLYDMLEVIPSASQETIHAAYRSLMSRYHPDKVATLGEELQALAATRTMEINHAYSVLRDAAQRAAYDEKLRREAVPSPHQDKLAVAQPAPPPVWRAEWEPSSPAEQLLAVAVAVIAGSLALFILPRVANVGLSIAVFLGTWNVSALPRLHDFITPLELDFLYADSTGTMSLLILAGCVFLNYWIGVASYNFGAGWGHLIASADWRYGEINCRRLFFWCLVFIVVAREVELLLSPQPETRVIGSIFILLGAYRAKEKV
jgi:DnaJ domain